MASTRGRKPLPLPASVVQALESHGFAQLPDDPEPRPWRQWWASAKILLVSSNIPGSTDVLISVNGAAPLLVSADVAAAMIVLHSVPRKGLGL